MGEKSVIHIADYYKELLNDEKIKIPTDKSWKLIMDKNEQRKENIAISEGDKRITYDEMFDKWKEMAKVFSAYNITRENNSRALVIMPNLGNTCYINYGLDMTGAVCDFIDPTTTLEKIEKYIESERITDIIGLDLLIGKNIGKKLSKLKSKYNIRNIIVFHDSYMNSLMPVPVKMYSNLTNQLNRFSGDIVRYEDAVRNSKFININYDNKGSKTLSLITHTSGTTTGIGKPIPLNDFNRNALAYQHDLAKLDFVPGMKMLHFIPYFAAYGSVNTANLGLYKGMELQQIPLFKPSDFAGLLVKYKPNIVLANMPAWMSLMNEELLEREDLSFLVCAISGGTPSKDEEEIKLNRFLTEHGCKVKLSKGYGLSEVCGCGTFAINDQYNHIGSMGVPLPLTEIKIRDIETNKIYSEEKFVTGEVLICSPTLTSGMLDGKMVVETIQIDGKRYLPTKDVVTVGEDGSLFFIERKDRMFPRYDAYNVYPLPIENMIKDEKDVNNCVIVPYFDKIKNGNMPRIYVELNEENENKTEWIRKIIDKKFLSQKTSSGYQANFRDIPTEWIFVPKIPRNTMGKEDYHKLKNEEMIGDKYYVEIEENNMDIGRITILKSKSS